MNNPLNQTVVGPTQAEDKQSIIATLRQANQDCIDRTTALLKMLGSCRNQFSLYAQSHKAKGTDDGDQKAATNESFVAQIDETLKEFRERAPKEQPEEAEDMIDKAMRD